MSVTFDAMLVLALRDNEAMRELNRLLHIKDEARHQTFNAIDMDGAGGSKFFTTDVWSACFNHFAPDDVEQCVCSTSWRHPDWVLYVRDLGDYHYDETNSLSAQTVTQLRQAA